MQIKVGNDGERREYLCDYFDFIEIPLKIAQYLCYFVYKYFPIDSNNVTLLYKMLTLQFYDDKLDLQNFYFY